MGKLLKILKEHTPTAIGVCLILGGSISAGSILYGHYKSEAEKNKLLSKGYAGGNQSVIITAPSLDSFTSDNEFVSEEEVLEIPELNEDMQVTPIKDGTQILEIPDLDIKVPILEGTSYDTLAVAAGHFKDTGKMGQDNYCIAGHSSSSYACIFDNLHNVKMDIPVYLHDGKGNKYTYRVTDWRTVQPADTWVVNSYGDTRCTIITCDDRGKSRLVVTAIMMTDEEHELYLREQAIQKRLELTDLSYMYSELGISRYLDTMTTPKDKRYGIYGDAFGGKLSEGYVIVQRRS